MAWDAEHEHQQADLDRRHRACHRDYYPACSDERAPKDARVVHALRLDDMLVSRGCRADGPGLPDRGVRAGPRFVDLLDDFHPRGGLRKWPLYLWILKFDLIGKVVIGMARSEIRDEEEHGGQHEEDEANCEVQLEMDIGIGSRFTLVEALVEEPENRQSVA